MLQFCRKLKLDKTKNGLEIDFPDRLKFASI